MAFSFALLGFVYVKPVAHKRTIFPLIYLSKSMGNYALSRWVSQPPPHPSSLKLNDCKSLLFICCCAAVAHFILPWGGVCLSVLSLITGRRMDLTHQCSCLSSQGYLPPTKNGAEPKRPSRPINITPLVRLSATVPNTIVVNWSSEFGRVSGNFSSANLCCGAWFGQQFFPIVVCV